MSKPPQIGIDAILGDVTPRTCDEYPDHLQAAASEEADASRRAKLELLADICTFHLRPESPLDPFGPMWQTTGRHSLIPADLNEGQLNTLKELAADVRDPDLRARVCDTLWVTQRDHSAATEAVKAYLEAGQTLLKEKHVAATARLERAARLSLLLGRKTPIFSEASSQLLRVLSDGPRELGLQLPLLELARELRLGEPEEMSKLARVHGDEALTGGNPFDAADLFQLEADWHASRDAQEDRSKALERKAEAYAQAARSATSAMVSTMWMEKAVSTYRSAGNRERFEELHRELLEVQKRVPSEMGAFSAEIDLTEAVRHAQRFVKDRPWPEVLLYFTGIVELINPSELRKDVERQLENHPLLGLITATSVDPEGRTVHQQPAAFGDPNEAETAIFALCCRQADLHRQLTVPGAILPARQVVLREHSCSERSLRRLVQHSPAVPPGREWSFAKGLHAGFCGDMLTATHLLLPQVEHSIRTTLADRGALVRTVEPDGTQRLFGLGRLLTTPDAVRVYGETITFELRSLLTDPAGSNLRNEALHGLEPDSYYLQEPAVFYFWWLALRLCLWPILSSGSDSITD